MFKALFTAFFLCFVAQANEDLPYVVRQELGSTKLYNQVPQRIVNYSSMPQKQIFFNVALGLNYTQSPSVSFTDGFITSNIPKEHYTTTILPIGLEYELPVARKVSFGFTANYILNPLSNSKFFSNSSVKIFEVQAQYSARVKLNYHISSTFLTYFASGIAAFDVNVYNDSSNAKLFTSNTIAPIVGFGVAINTSPSVRFFAETSISFFDKINKIQTNNPRINAISQRKYTSVQTQVGINVALKKF